MKNQKNQSPLVDYTNRISGITNSGDIVKVKESGYVVTNSDDCCLGPADLTLYAQVSNKID